jgi:hypothetical protein
VDEKQRSPGRVWRRVLIRGKTVGPTWLLLLSGLLVTTNPPFLITTGMYIKWLCARAIHMCSNLPFPRL